MGVLAEAISVVVRRDAIEGVFLDGWQGFLKSVPNATLCSDGSLVRVGFMVPDDAAAFVTVLETGGLELLPNSQSSDFCVVDQLTGPTTPAPWLRFEVVETEGGNIAACWLREDLDSPVAVPEHWKFKGSMSDKPLVVKSDGSIRDRLTYVGRDGGNDVYLNKETGERLFVARPKIEGDAEIAISTRLSWLIHEALALEEDMGGARGAGHAGKQQRAAERIDSHLLPFALELANGPGHEMSKAHFTLGLVLRIRGRFEDALKEFGSANELAPGTVDYLREVVLCLGVLGRASEALPFAKEAAQLAPEDAGVWGNLAAILAQCGQKEEGRLALEHALRLDPDDKINENVRRRFYS